MKPADNNHRKKSSVMRRVVVAAVVLLLAAGVLLLIFSPKHLSQFAQELAQKDTAKEATPLAILDSGILSIEEGGQTQSIDLKPFVRKIAEQVFFEQQKEDDVSKSPKDSEELDATNTEKEDASNEAGEDAATVQNVYNSYSTTVVEEGEPNTDEQTLSLSGNVLSISGGNSIVLPSSPPAQPEEDGVVGNEVANVVSGGGLLRVGSGTTLDPYAVQLQACANGEILKSSGAGAWDCAADSGGISYAAGSGLQLMGAEFAVNSPTCSGTDKLQWNGTTFICSADIDTDTDTNTDAQTLSWTEGTRTLGIANGNSVTIGDADTTYSVQGAGGLGMNGTQLALIACADGQILKAQLTSGQWACEADIDTDTDTNTTYDAGSGLQMNGTTLAVNSPTCSGTDKLQWDGTSFACGADVDTDTNTDAQTLSWTEGTRTLGIANGNTVTIGDADTTYSAQIAGGLSLSGTQFALVACADGQVLKAQPTSGQWACAADVDTDTDTTYSTGSGLQMNGTTLAVNSPTCSGTDKLQWNGTAFICSADIDTDTDTNTIYSAGTGLSLAGATFSNTGLLSLAVSGALTSTGGQTPTIAFADGTASGQFWQWNGTAWVLAALPNDNGVTAVGSFDSQTKSANGAVIAGNTLYLQSADVTSPGLVTTGAQTFAGIKTYQGAILANGGLGIGVATANNDLEVNSGSADTSGLRLTQLTSASTAGASNGKVLSVDTNGDVVLVDDSDTVTMQNAYDNGNTITTTSVARDVTIQSGVGANSTSAFEVLNELGDQTFAVDTTNGRVVIGHDPSFQGAKAKLYFGDTANANNLWIGEADGADTDILQLQGKLGLRLSVGDIADTVLSIGADGSLLTQNGTDSGAGFAVADAAGKYMFSVDTTAKEVHIGDVASGTELAGVRLVMGDTGCSASAHSCISFSEDVDDVLRIHSEAGMKLSSADGTTRLWVDPNSATEIGINTEAPTNTLDVNGTLRVRTFGSATATSVCSDINGVLSSCSSSRRYKTNIEDLGYGLRTLEAMRPVGFNWIGTGQRDIGFIAEEMAQVVPEVITYKNGQIEGINYSALTAVLASAIQEQQLQIDQLRQSAWNGGIVAMDTTFNDFVAFNGNVEFNGSVQFADNVTFTDNMAGSVELAAGQTSAQVTFSAPHNTVPIVTATPQDFLAGTYRISSTTKDGFIIELNQAQANTVRLNWTAIQVTN